MDATKSPVNFEMLLDVKVKLTVELGSCQVPMRDARPLLTPCERSRYRSRPDVPAIASRRGA